MNNRTLGNLFGDDSSRFAGLFGYGNTLGGNVADGVSLFFGLTHPSELYSCASAPQDFLLKVDKFNVQKLRPAFEASLDLTQFVAFTQSEMACLLNFRYDYIQVAQVAWALERLYVALELKLNNCENSTKKRFKIIKKKRK